MKEVDVGLVIVFYFGLTLLILALLYLRNWAAQADWAPKSFWLPSAGVLALTMVAMFAAMAVHFRLFGEYVQALENEWVRLVVAFGPIIWMGIVAACYNRLFGQGLR
jgi:hypothetical protein